MKITAHLDMLYLGLYMSKQSSATLGKFLSGKIHPPPSEHVCTDSLQI
jgi:hypothetical protein